MRHRTMLLLTALAGAGCGDEKVGTRDTAADAAPETSQPDTTVVETTAAPDTEVPHEVREDVTSELDTTEPVDTNPVITDVTKDVAPDVVEPPPLEVKFVVMGDTGEGNERQYKVAAAIQSRCAVVGCDFAILLGDNFYDSGVESVLDQQWIDKFEDPYENVDMPFYAVLGNHDNGGFLSQVFGDAFGGAGAEFERGNNQVAYTTISDKWRMPGRTYDFVAGPAHFFALDTNDMVWSLIDDGAEDRTHIQVDTFPAMIDESTSTWRIAFGHHPYLSNGEHGNAGEYEGLEEGITDAIKDVNWLGDIGAVVAGKGVKDALDEIACGRVDLYFGGHDHSRQWFVESEGACAGTTFVVSGAGAKITDLEGDQPVLFQNNTKAGFFWVHLRGNAIAVEAVDEDGTVEWSHQGVR